MEKRMWRASELFFMGQTSLSKMLKPTEHNKSSGLRLELVAE
jgi:hypothetical protein